MRVLFYIRSVYDNLVGKYAVNTFAYVEDNSLLYKGDIFRSYFVSMEYRFSILVNFLIDLSVPINCKNLLFLIRQCTMRFMFM